ncbi:MAG TPA: type II secretion system F family protein [Woeseiaceae bacterium]
MQGLLQQIAIASGDELVLRQLMVWLTALSAFVLVLGGSVLVMNRINPLRRRIDSLPEGTGQKGDLVRILASLVTPVAAFVLPQDELERNGVMTQLHRAGYRTSFALQVFYLAKTLLIIVLPLLVLVASNWMPDLKSKNVVLYALFASGFGMLLPNMILRRMVERRARALTHGFPDALDLLVVCVESGLGLAAAIQRVADELDVSHPELAFELATVNTEIRVGVQREQALRNLAERTGLEDIRGLVGLLVQTMRFGTGIADTLRVYSEEFRDKRTQKAEEQAAKMGTKLVFPLVLFMFPIFFIVAIGPAVLRVIDAFSGM